MDDHSAVDDAIRDDVRSGRQIDAIRRYRKATNASLLDAKAHVDSLARSEGAILPSSGPRFYIILIGAIAAIVIVLRYFYGTSGVTHVPH